MVYGSQSLHCIFQATTHKSLLSLLYMNYTWTITKYCHGICHSTCPAYVIISSGLKWLLWFEVFASHSGWTQGQAPTSAWPRLPSKSFVLKFNLRSAKKFYDKSTADGAEDPPKPSKTPGAKGPTKTVKQKGEEEAKKPAPKRRRRQWTAWTSHCIAVVALSIFESCGILLGCGNSHFES